jgi:hydrogenase maturation protease
MSDYEKEINPIVIGLGNPLMGDDGIGVVVARDLQARAAVGALVVEAGTPGFGLVDVLTEDRTLIFIDAVDAGAKPGSVFWVDPADLIDESHRLSLHQITLRDVLELLGQDRLRSRVKIIGIQPHDLGAGIGLSGELDASLADIIAATESMINEVL